MYKFNSIYIEYIRTTKTKNNEQNIIKKGP